MIRAVFSILFLVSLLGCAGPAPTKVYESKPRQFDQLMSGATRPIVITDETVILDARPAFEYAVTHAPGAIHVAWTDFTNRGGPPGLLKKDIFAEARRLARMGIALDSSVVVVGNGPNGNGEEGRVAWTLIYLGLKNVQIAALDSLGIRYSNVTPVPRQAVPTWIPEPVEQIQINKKEFLDLIRPPRSKDTFIIDVRSKREYFSKDQRLQYQLPDMGALHIEWKEFFDKNGRPNPKIKNQLRAIGVGLNDTVIVISNNGVRSGAVTYSMLSLGFKNALNYSGGYTDLIQMK